MSNVNITVAGREIKVQGGYEKPSAGDAVRGQFNSVSDKTNFAGYELGRILNDSLADTEWVNKSFGANVSIKNDNPNFAMSEVIQVTKGKKLRFEIADGYIVYIQQIVTPNAKASVGIGWKSESFDFTPLYNYFICVVAHVDCTKPMSVKNVPVYLLDNYENVGR